MREFRAVVAGVLVGVAVIATAVVVAHVWTAANAPDPNIGAGLLLLASIPLAGLAAVGTALWLARPRRRRGA